MPQLSSGTLGYRSLVRVAEPVPGQSRHSALQLLLHLFNFLTYDHSVCKISHSSIVCNVHTITSSEAIGLLSENSSHVPNLAIYQTVLVAVLN